MARKEQVSLHAFRLSALGMAVSSSALHEGEDVCAHLDRCHIQALIGRALADELRQQHSPAVHIRLARVQLVPDHLRRHIHVRPRLARQARRTAATNCNYSPLPYITCALCHRVMHRKQPVRISRGQGVVQGHSACVRD